MDITETLYVPTREEWRAWLAAHYDTKPEIWLVSYKKQTGIPGVPYNAAVEEALCFGWIDGIRKSIDPERYAQRYTPRRAGSPYSRLNRERLAQMLAQGKVIPSVAAQVGEPATEEYRIPDDIRAALQAREQAWAFFLTTSPAYQRIRVDYVEHARPRPEEFERRLRNLVDKCARGKQFGYGIEDYY